MIHPRRQHEHNRKDNRGAMFHHLSSNDVRHPQILERETSKALLNVPHIVGLRGKSTAHDIELKHRQVDDLTYDVTAPQAN